MNRRQPAPYVHPNLTEAQLTYTRARLPTATALWFERQRIVAYWEGGAHLLYVEMAPSAGFSFVREWAGPPHVVEACDPGVIVALYHAGRAVLLAEAVA